MKSLRDEIRLDGEWVDLISSKLGLDFICQGFISSRLMEMNIKAPRGGKVWGIETIRKILNNEKYYGDVLLQKTYIADFFTGKQVPNRGECESYLLKHHHEAIIYDKDIFTLITD